MLNRQVIATNKPENQMYDAALPREEGGEICGLGCDKEIGG